tara:strand:- start:85575 stop:86975 length:1401 start_codon:yes stop_codon:yes gene_type:complete
LDLYILGIGGTFMGHLALLAKQLGFNVSGCDHNVYSPMREMLQENHIQYDEGYSIEHLKDSHKLYVVGNAISRGNPMIEAILNQRKPYTSGPAWLREHLLQNKHVIAIAGTHGKTTTTSMVTWVLKQLDYKPGYLIGGAAKGFERAADIGASDYFVIEADEYDTAFFDKRSKFIHYMPETLILNNLEFDHADIFDSIEDIKKTMHHLVRTVPSQGLVITPAADTHLTSVLEKGCWSRQCKLTFDTTASDSQLSLDGHALNEEASEIEITSRENGKEQKAVLKWNLIGQHNLANATAALAAVMNIGITLADAVNALSTFGGVSRRMDLRFQFDNINVYDDFAHHPTAITLSLKALRAKVGREKIIALIEPRSNTMTMGVHQNQLLEAVQGADEVYWLKHPRLSFDLEALCSGLKKTRVFDTAEEMLEHVLSLHATDERNAVHWLCMSNGAFGGFFDLLKARQLETAS